MNTKENNKLIAYFMASDRETNLPKGSLHFIGLNLCYLTPESMEKGYYGDWHSDWNLLMGVVKKIMNMDEPPKESKGWYAYHGIDQTLSMVDKKTTYNHIVDFITWYNEQ